MKLDEKLKTDQNHRAVLFAEMEILVFLVGLSVLSVSSLSGTSIKKTEGLLFEGSFETSLNPS